MLQDLSIHIQIFRVFAIPFLCVHETFVPEIVKFLRVYDIFRPWCPNFVLSIHVQTVEQTSNTFLRSSDFWAFLSRACQFFSISVFLSYFCAFLFKHCVGVEIFVYSSDFMVLKSCLSHFLQIFVRSTDFLPWCSEFRLFSRPPSVHYKTCVR